MAFDMQFLESLRPRFEAKFKRDKASQCWIWTGSKKKFGYGRLSVIINKAPTNILAHRLSLAYKMGYWPDKDIFACHHCDVPACVNPAHLYAGTAADNVRDAYARHRAKSWMVKGYLGLRREMSKEQAREALSLFFGEEGGGIVAAIRRDPNGINYNNIMTWFKATGHQVYSYVIQGNTCEELHKNWVREAQSLWFSKGAQGYYCVPGTATAKWTLPTIQDLLDVDKGLLRQFLTCNSYPDIWRTFFNERPHLRRFLSAKNRFTRDFDAS